VPAESSNTSTSSGFSLTCTFTSLICIVMVSTLW